MILIGMSGRLFDMGGNGAESWDKVSTSFDTFPYLHTATHLPFPLFELFGFRGEIY